MYEYLKDQRFLNLLDNNKIKTQYVKIIILDFAENPIREIQGTVQSGGSISVNGASSLRRTCSFTMFASAATNDLTNIDNLISLNKKIKIIIGYKNTVRGYEHYGEIIWFKGGTYVVMQASLSNSTSGSTISIQGRDKMVFLNGQAGGIIPSALVLHERYEYMNDNIINITYPTIFQIIQEVVSEYGGENISNIVISDLELKTKQLIKYIGKKYLHLRKDGGKWLENNQSEEEWNKEHEGTTLNNSWFTYSYGQDIGYQETDFTYPGEFKVTAGSTVTSVLDKICQLLGNYEYFYDVEGRFIFQEKKNFLNTTYTPVTTFNGKAYIKNFSDSKYIYTFKDLEQTINVNSNPKYENIKNDFLVWGKKQSGTQILYHLAIDAKPQLFLANKYMWELLDINKKFLRYEYTSYFQEPSITSQDIVDYYTILKAELFAKYFKDLLTEEELEEIKDLDNYFYKIALSDQPEANISEELIKLEETLRTMEEKRIKEAKEETENIDNISPNKYDEYIKEKEELNSQMLNDMISWEQNNYTSSIQYNLVAYPCADWREEIYRQALERSIAGLAPEPYDTELLTFWRTLYYPFPQNITDVDGKRKTVNWYNKETLDAWNPDVFNNPSALVYWLDFLDDGDDLRKYSVSAIGRRTKVHTSDNIRNIFNSSIEDILFVENNFSTDRDREKEIEKLKIQGQAYLLYKSSQSQLFSISSTGASAFDTIRDLIYQHLTYNATVTITCLPKYYLEPNNLIHIVDTQNGVSGDYIITQFSLPLNYQGTMSITASEALIRI